MPEEKADVPNKTEVKENNTGATNQATDNGNPSEPTKEAATTAAQPIAEASNAEATTREADTGKPLKRRLSFRKIVPLIVLLFAVLILYTIAGGWNRWVGGRGKQQTDDAYLRADITPLSTRLSGTVALVAVEDYQQVKAGDLLVQLKNEDFLAQVSQAEAGVQGAQAALVNNTRQKELQDSRVMQAQAGVESARADLLQGEAALEAAKSDVANAQAGVAAAQEKIVDAQAGVDAAQADAERTRLERSRQAALVDIGSATRQKLEQVVADEERYRAILNSRKAELAQTRALLESRRADFSKARAQVALRQAEIQRARAQISGRTAELDAQGKQRAVVDAQELQLQADLSAKQEALKVAQTNLEYTRIVAPTDGIVGERKVRVGQLVSPGTQVISLVENSIWVQANYKETQLTDVAKGDAAEVTVDALPGVVLKGHVEEIAPASGSQFALLPPDNAAGNYTKVVQRIPVKIVLDLDPAIAKRLRPGMSVIAEIKTTAKSKG